MYQKFNSRYFKKWKSHSWKSLKLFTDMPRAILCRQFRRIEILAIWWSATNKRKNSIILCRFYRHRPYASSVLGIAPLHRRRAPLWQRRSWTTLSRARRRSTRVKASINTCDYLRWQRRVVNGGWRKVDTLQRGFISPDDKAVRSCLASHRSWENQL